MNYTLLAEPKYPLDRKFEMKFNSFGEAIDTARNLFAVNNFISIRLRHSDDSIICGDVIHDILQMIDALRDKR